MIRSIFRAAALAALMAFISCQTADNRKPETPWVHVIPDSIMNNIPELPDNPAMAFVRNLEIAINIGNSLDSIGTLTWHAGEKGWGNPEVTQTYVQALKNYGYKTIRLPVTWAEYMGPAPNYIISEERMNRVQEVVNWILEEDMYCIINLHHDGGHADKSWILEMSTREEEVLRQFEIIWEQIALRFRGYSDKLILESFNEIGFDDLWSRWGGGRGTKGEAYRKLNLLNQAFVNTVRKTGGDNEDRFLLIAGYWTDIALTCDPLFIMPIDTVEHRLTLSVHYYTPSTFAIAEQPNNSWGFRADWGTPMDYTELTQEFNRLRRTFLEKGIPVILGEYGVTLLNKVEEGRVRWMAAVTQLSLNYGICPVLWDTGWKIDPWGENEHGGEISRYEPYEMRHSLQSVWTSLKMP